MMQRHPFRVQVGRLLCRGAADRKRRQPPWGKHKWGCELTATLTFNHLATNTNIMSLCV